MPYNMQGAPIYAIVSTKKNSIFIHFVNKKLKFLAISKFLQWDLEKGLISWVSQISWGLESLKMTMITLFHKMTMMTLYHKMTMVTLYHKMTMVTLYHKMAFFTKWPWWPFTTKWPWWPFTTKWPWWPLSLEQKKNWPADNNYNFPTGFKSTTPELHNKY